VPAATSVRRLAGIAFEAQPPPSPDVLPRMDVAGLVGFAAAGPVNIPVPVEDSASFAEVFGGDAPLAWDPVRGEQTIAQLAPAARAFFRNGGRRAWIVRVAGERAQRALLPVPNLVASVDGELTAAALPARSVGSWGDALRIETALESRPATVVTASLSSLQFRLEAPSGDTIVPGDLLRLSKDGYELLVAVASATAASVPPLAGAPGRTVFDVTGPPDAAVWLQSTLTGSVTGRARLDGLAQLVDVTVTSGAEGVEVALTAPYSLVPELGALLSIEQLSDASLGRLFVVVRDIRRDDGSFTIAGDPFCVLAGPPASPPAFAAGDAVERLTLELSVDRGAGEHWSLDELGFAPGHPRYVGDLPTDEELYARHDGEVDPPEPPALWSDAASPRFPLAGARAVFLPLGMTAAYGPQLGATHLRGTPLGRDGLNKLDDALFLDPGVREHRLDTLLSTAQYIRWQSATPRPLTGIHALLALDEVTLAAVPDAVHRGWRKHRHARLPAAPKSDPAPSPPADGFARCSWRVLAAPRLRSTRPDAGGTFTLSWDKSVEPERTYVLQETATLKDWTTAVTIYSGPATMFELFARPRGTYAYRVRVESEGNVSDWSNGVVVAVAPPPDWRLLAESAYSPTVLLAVQRELLRMCAARGDMLAVLSAPDHYREAAAADHADALRAPTDPVVPGRAPPRVEPFDASEASAFAHGVLYHPWLTSSRPESPDTFVRTSPDGQALGVLADRAATRGAWVAPANVVLRDVVALEPIVPHTALESLLQAQVNEVRQEPDGFLWMSADTLALDDELRPVNVRRLIALVRRLALLRGVDYVFEPNGDLFRRRVQRGFENTLNELYVLGAFAGATPTDSFRVDIDASQQSLDEGRLVVELKFAPSRPLAFLTVRLVGDADRSFRVVTD
jgi:hypothetical protein